MIKRLASSSLALGFVVASMTGCADGTSDRFIASAEIGPAGGALETDFGVTVTVPPGVFEDQTVVTAEFDAVSGQYRFSPIGRIFETAVIVTVASDDSPTGEQELALRCFDDLGACAELGDGYNFTRPWVPGSAADFNGQTQNVPGSGDPNVVGTPTTPTVSAAAVYSRIIRK